MVRFGPATLFATALVLSGCGEAETNQIVLQQRLLPSPNPTNYEYHASLNDVKAAIQKAYDDWHFETSKNYADREWGGTGDNVSKRVYSRALQLVGHQLLLWKGEGDSLTRGLLSEPGNENDAYLCSQEAPLCESCVYFNESQPLLYYAEFHFHLTVVSPQKTRLGISTYDSKVAAAVDQKFSPVHGPGLKLVEVSPTTVEEYEMLLRIGERLGVKDMPPLLLPGPNSPVSRITKAEKRGEKKMRGPQSNKSDEAIRRGPDATPK